MAFPQTPLQVRVDLQIGGTWTDITSDTLARDGANSITITRGRADEAARADASACKLSLKSPGGKYSGKNPSSPYYGLIGRNSPLRVGIGVPPAGTSLGGQSGAAIVAPSVTAEAAGNLFCVWAAGPVGNFTPPGAFAVSVEQDGALSTWQTGTKAVAAGATGTSSAAFSVAATSGAAVSIAVPGTITGTGVTSFVQAGGNGGVLLPGTVAAGDYILVICGQSSDPANRMQNVPADTVATPGWMLLADTGPSAGPRIKAFICRATAAASRTFAVLNNDGISDTYGAAWVITGATDYLPRVTTEVSELPPKWDLSGKDVWVPIQASGITRRLGQGASPLHSVLTRQLSRGISSVLAYWPMEDPAGSTVFASAIGGTPMAFLGAPTLAADTGFSCSAALPTFAAAGAVGSVPAYVPAGTGQFLVGALISAPAAGMVDQTTLLSIAATGGTVASWSIKYASTLGGTFRVQAFAADGTSLLDLTPGGPFTVPVAGSRFFVYLSATISGSDVAWLIRYVPIVAGSNFPTSQNVSGTIVGATAGRVTRVTVGQARDLAGAPTVGHVVVTSDPLSLFTATVWYSLVGWNGEFASDRIRRLCREESIPVYVAYPAVSAAMGPQLPNALLDLLGQCETADGGILFEPKGFLGLAYRTRSSQYNQGAALTLSYSGGNISEPFEPTDDDQGTLNDATVTRTGGSAARSTVDSGPLSTLPPPAGVGRYDDSFELNLTSDAQLPDQAGWRTHKGTWDEARYPSVHVDLARNPSLVNALTAADVGDLVTLTGLPAFVPPGPVDQLLEGYTESLGHPIDWDIVGNFVPAGPYRVGVTDSTTYGRADSATSTLNGGFTATDNPISVSVAAGSAPWITSGAFPAQFPFDIVVAGEVMTVTAIGPVSFTAQPFTVVRSVNGVVKAQIGGTPVRLARPTAVAL